LEEVAPHKDKEVANGVKKAFQMLFPASIQTEVREEFTCFVAGLEDFQRYHLWMRGGP
jgi:hypothetical protein